MNTQKLLNVLTICRKASKAEMGFDAAKEALSKGKATLILLASDLSPKTEKEIRFFAEKAHTPVLSTEMTIEETGVGIGRKVGIIAVCDEGFSKKISALSAE